MRIAVIGCVHGELTKAYAAIRNAKGKPVDLVIMCGDIQACRTPQDMESMSVPAKYRRMGDFHEYFSGAKTAPILTVVVGGNHEASVYMTTLENGGWLAPNIWYIGNAGVVEVDGLRIGGLSGIYYEPDAALPMFEAELFAKNLEEACNSNAKYSVYHTRQTTIDAMKKWRRSLDIFVTHDWPRGIEAWGDTKLLLKQKPWFKQDIKQGQLGNPLTAELLDILRPQWWLSAHLHTHFQAKYKKTRFLALDKVLPRRKFMEIIEVTGRHEDSPDMGLVRLR